MTTDLNCSQLQLHNINHQLFYSSVCSHQSLHVNLKIIKHTLFKIKNFNIINCIQKLRQTELLIYAEVFVSVNVHHQLIILTNNKSLY